MSTLRTWIRARLTPGRLAQLVMAVSALVALASSPPPRYAAVEQRQLQLVFEEQSERRLLLSVVLDGKIYAEAGGGSVEVSARTSRTASDFELSVRPPDEPEPSPEAAAPAEPRSEAEADFRAGLDPPSEEDDRDTVRPDVRNPAEARLSVPVQCLVTEPGQPRPESCVEQLEITLARDSERPLSVDLDVSVYVGTRRPARPAGTFEVTLEELTP